MRKDIPVFLFLAFFGTIVFYKSFGNFFSQDDFILISHFSGNGFLTNLTNAFGQPTVTHWRPLHGLYFLISGTVFGKNYFFYHLLTFGLHIAGSFFVYKVVMRISANEKAAFCAALLYALSPIHFVSLTWISGGATVIGFFFFITSFYSYLCKRKILSIILFVLSFLASEAMVVGVLIFLVWTMFNKKYFDKFVLVTIGLISLVFGVVRITFLNPGNISASYKLNFSSDDLLALKYYLARIFGVSEGANWQLKTLLIIWVMGILILLVNYLRGRRTFENIAFGVFIILVGLFPFVLIPEHLSGHYMNISVFGLSLTIGILISKARDYLAWILVVIFALISFSSVITMGGNHWAVQRANLAKKYLDNIESQHLPYGSTIIFDEGKISTSKEAYIALGTGEAVTFWFNKQYKSCFTFFENCRR